MEKIQLFYAKINNIILKVSIKNMMLILLGCIILSLYLIGQFKVLWVGIIPMAICGIVYYLRMSNVYYSVRVFMSNGDCVYDKVKYRFDKKRNILTIIDENNGQMQFQNCQFSVTQCNH